MFNYTDPTGTGHLAQSGALGIYKSTLDDLYHHFAKLARSGFTLLEAFEGLEASQIKTHTVDWLAFPKQFISRPAAVIDARRLFLQEEYVEWQVEKDNNGVVQRITFTTEFRDYFQSLAGVGADALLDEVRKLYPDADVSLEEILGPKIDFVNSTAAERMKAFDEWLPFNPWNNGEKGILCLTHGANTIGALFKLLGECSIKKENVDSDVVCSLVNGACAPGRNSDPNICQAVQDLARSGKSFTLEDPAGIVIKSLHGFWQLDGTDIDINNPSGNHSIWKVLRNGRRAVLDLSRGSVTLDSSPVRSGAQVAAKLLVGSTVIISDDTVLPEWARIGKERILSNSFRNS